MRRRNWPMIQGDDLVSLEHLRFYTITPRTWVYIEELDVSVMHTDRGTGLVTVDTNTKTLLFGADTKDWRTKRGKA